MANKIKFRTAQAGEVYAYFIEDLNKYCAYQILAADRQSITYVALDYLFETLPQFEKLESLQPFYSMSFRNEFEMVKSIIQKSPVPDEFIYIGTTSLKADSICNTYSGNWPTGSAFVANERWNNLDKEVQKTYIQYANCTDPISINGKVFPKCFRVLNEELFQALNDSDTLSELPCIRSADVSGYSERLVQLLCETPMLIELYLKQAGAPVVDLSKTHLTHLVIDASGVTKLIFPSTMERLELYGDISEEFTIDADLCHRKVFLKILVKNDILPMHISNHLKLNQLSLQGIKNLDLDTIANLFPNAEVLYLAGPGYISNFSGIEKMKNLKSLMIQDLFGYNEDDLVVLQTLPKLNVIDFESIPYEAGMFLKTQFKGKVRELRVTKLRDDGWLRENLTNPIRHWDGDEFVPKAACPKAFKCYKDTRVKLQSAATKEEIEKIVCEYTTLFNQLNAKYNEFIETTEREDIYAAMEQLYNDCICPNPALSLVSLEDIWRIMDEVRDNW